MQKIEIIEGAGDSQTKADTYKSVFGVCCENSKEEIIFNTIKYNYEFNRYLETRNICCR